MQKEKEHKRAAALEAEGINLKIGTVTVRND